MAEHKIVVVHVGRPLELAFQLRGDTVGYREHKVREGVLSAQSINKTITRLGQILAVAEERDLVARNPVRVNTRNRKLKARRPRAVFLDSAEAIQALLDAATDLDGRSVARTGGRRALIAALAFAGLRIGEACALRWRVVDLASGRILVGESKTDAGVREVEVLAILRDELDGHKLRSRASGPEDLVFTTATGAPRDRTNARQRVIVPVVEHAEELLAERGQPPLPAGVTAHKLRHTFASVLVMLGEDPAHVMGQLGHTDPAFTRRVYTHAMRRDEGAKERMRALIEGRDWARLGTGGTSSPPEAAPTDLPESDATRTDAGTSEDGRGWFRTSDLSRLKRGAGGSRRRTSAPRSVEARRPRGWSHPMVEGQVAASIAGATSPPEDPRMSATQATTSMPTPSTRPVASLPR